MYAFDVKGRRLVNWSFVTYSTSTLDRFGNSMFVLSTSYAACSVPLGVVVVSDEKQGTIQCGLKKLQEVLPNRAFYGRSAVEGPSLVMTDDSTAEREFTQYLE